MPKCYLCGTEDEKLFYPDRTKKSGFTNRCYPCDKAYLRKYNKSPNRKKYNRDRERNRRHGTLKSAINYRQKQREYYWNNREKILEHLKEYRRRPGQADKIRARTTLNRNIRLRRIIKPDFCDKCGKQGSMNAHHHKGYAREHALDVEWLCDTCHGKLHRI